MKVESVISSNNNSYYGTANSNQSQVTSEVEAAKMRMGNGTENVNNNFPAEKKLIELIEKSNKDLVLSNTSLKFSIHETTKEIIVKVINNETKEVIREIPPEKILDMIASMLEKTGVFIDKKA
jgi:flagellar protein FlaG